MFKKLVFCLAAVFWCTAGSAATLDLKDFEFQNQVVGVTEIAQNIPRLNDGDPTSVASFSFGSKDGGGTGSPVVALRYDVSGLGAFDSVSVTVGGRHFVVDDFSSTIAKLFDIRIGAVGFGGSFDFIDVTQPVGQTQSLTLTRGTNDAFDLNRYLNPGAGELEIFVSSTFGSSMCDTASVPGNALCFSSIRLHELAVTPNLTNPPAPVPLPAGLPLLAAGLGALALVRRKRS
ncbi:MAG: VPLPA-CTERM sorting domain-containing protein [Pseudomonadota bacterium]